MLLVLSYVRCLQTSFSFTTSDSLIVLLSEVVIRLPREVKDSMQNCIRQSNKYKRIRGSLEHLPFASENHIFVPDPAKSKTWLFLLHLKQQKKN